MSTRITEEEHESDLNPTPLMTTETSGLSVQVPTCNDTISQQTEPVELDSSPILETHATTGNAPIDQPRASSAEPGVDISEFEELNGEQSMNRLRVEVCNKWHPFWHESPLLMRLFFFFLL